MSKSIIIGFFPQTVAHNQNAAFCCKSEVEKDAHNYFWGNHPAKVFEWSALPIHHVFFPKLQVLVRYLGRYIKKDSVCVKGKRKKMYDHLFICFKYQIWNQNNKKNSLIKSLFFHAYQTMEVEMRYLSFSYSSEPMAETVTASFVMQL